MPRLKLVWCPTFSRSMILDVGVMAQHYSGYLLQMILWNGPVGVFEMNQFAVGTEAVAHAVVDSTAYSLAGGGDTVALSSWPERSSILCVNRRRCFSWCIPRSGITSGQSFNEGVFLC